VSKRYFNGKIGVVKKLLEEEILVDCDGEEIYVMPETWENNRYVLNRVDGKLEQENLGSFTQFPLRLAWAITIHKSQGLTFERVMIDAGAAFSSGQVYVALSRCTSLDGIVLLSKIPAVAIYSNENVIKGQQSLTHKGSLAERFAGARQIFTQQLLEEIFSFNESGHLTQLLLSQIKAHRSKLNKEAVEWADNLNNQITIEERIGLKFSFQIAELLREEPEIEKNEPLQNRINAAADHFIPKFSDYLQSLKNHPLVTEHREVAAEINNTLSQLLLSLYTTNYFLEYCRNPFSVTEFLSHKLKFVTPRLNITCYASGKSQSFSDVPNGELYDSLKRWRDLIVEENSVPIFMVASHASLKEIAQYLPITKKDLMKINGFGKAKVEKYGDDILDTVQDYCLRHELESNMTSLRHVEKKERKPASETNKTDTKEVSYNLFKEGKSMAEIAEERKLTLGTVEGHLAVYVEKGDIDIDLIVSTEKQLLIKAAEKLYGDQSVKAIKDNLPENISYGEIKMVLADLKNNLSK
ncbi:MAG: helix-turn-helix domain-containing protein, partial [Ginsengibacter sp.]